MAEPLVKFAVTAGVARVSLNRPEKRNALNPELIAALRDALGRTAADESVKVVLLRGEGKDFCAGMDLAALAQFGSAGPLDHLADARTFADLFVAMRHHPRPIVAAIHGRALAGGCGLAMACDLVLAAHSAHFRYTEVDIGFVPAIVAAVLRRNVGEKRAFELLAAGAGITASEAHSIGMVNHVYPDTGFDDQVEEYVAKLAQKSPSAVTLTKSLLYSIDGMTFESAVEAGVQTNALARMTEDAQRGFQHFAQKKK